MSLEILSKEYANSVFATGPQLDGKQDKLTAGENITIDENNVISAESQKYTYISENDGSDYAITIGKSTNKYAKWVMIGSGGTGLNPLTAIEVQGTDTFVSQSKIILRTGAPSPAANALTSISIASPKATLPGTLELKIGNVELVIDQAKLTKLKEFLEA